MTTKEAIQVMKKLREQVKTEGDYETLFTDEFVGALELTIEALKLKYYHDEAERRKNPCNSCDMAWARISNDGVTGCHDHCEKLRTWAEALGIGV